MNMHKIRTVEIHPDLADGNYHTQRFALKSHGIGVWQLIPIALADPSCQIITDIAKIAEIINSPKVEIVSSRAYLKLTRRINDLVYQYNGKNDQAHAATAVSILDRVPYVKQCVGWLLPSIPYPHTFTMQAMLNALSYHAGHLETLGCPSLDELRCQIQDLLRYCLCTQEEKSLLKDNLQLLETYLAWLGDPATTATTRDMVKGMTTAQFRERCFHIKRLADQSQSLCSSNSIGKAFSMLMSCKEAELFPELSAANVYLQADVNVIKSDLGMNSPHPVDVVTKLFEKALIPLTLTEQTRKRYDPSEIERIGQAIRKIESVYFSNIEAHLLGMVERFYNVTSEDLTYLVNWIDLYKAKFDPSVNIIEKFRKIKYFFTLRFKLTTLDKYFKKATSATIARQCDCAYEQLKELHRLYGEIVPHANKETANQWFKNVREMIIKRYEFLIAENMSPYIIAKDLNLGEFTEELEAMDSLDKGCALIAHTLKRLEVSEAQRLFLSSEEVQLIHSQRKALLNARVDWVLLCISKHVICPNAFHILSKLKSFMALAENSEVSADRCERMKAVVETYEPALKKLISDIGSVWDVTGFKTNDLNVLYGAILRLNGSCQAILKLHSELFPDEINPWVKFLKRTQKKYIDYLYDVLGATDIEQALYVATLTTPLFSTHQAEKSVGTIISVFNDFEGIMQSLNTRSEGLTRTTLDEIEKAKQTIQAAFDAWIARWVAHHMHTTLTPDEITADVFYFLTFMNQNFNEIEGELFKICFLQLYDKVRPVANRYLHVPVAADEYAIHFKTFLKDYFTRVASKKYGTKFLEDDQGMNSEDKCIYFSLNGIGPCILRAINPVNRQILAFFHPARLEELIHARRMYNRMHREISEWEGTPHPERIVFRKKEQLEEAARQNNVPPRFVVLYSNEHYQVFFNPRQTLTYQQILDKMKAQKPKDPSCAFIASLAQFEEVANRFNEQEQIEHLDHQFCLAETAIRRISPASVLHLPSMPADLVRSGLYTLTDILKTINFTAPQKPGYVSPQSDENDMRFMLRQMIRLVKGRLEYSGIPKQNPMREKWYLKFEALLRNCILIMRDRFEAASNEKKESVLKDNQAMVIEIAKIAGFCGARWVTELNTVFGILTGRLDVLFDANLAHSLHKLLDIYKRGILEEMANETPSDTEYQSSHGLIYYMQALSKRGYLIPEAELADYEDIYDALGKSGKYKTFEDVEKRFRSRLTASCGVRTIHLELNQRMLNESRTVILNDLREMVRGRNELPELERLKKEFEDDLNQIKANQAKECALTPSELEILHTISKLKRSEFAVKPEFALERTAIKILIQTKPSHVLTFAKEFDAHLFEGEKRREQPLTEEEVKLIQRLREQKTISAEDKGKLTELAAAKPCHLAVHVCGGEWIYLKIDKEPYCMPNLLNRFGWIVVPFAKQIDALKERHASMVEEVLDEELLKEGLLRKETRVMQKPGSDEWISQEVKLLTVQGTLLLVRKSGLLEKK